MTIASVDYETILQLVYRLPTQQQFALVHDVLQSLEPSALQHEPTLPRASEIPAHTEDDRSLDDEAEWLYAAANNPAFHSLHDPAEDIYSISDGEPIYTDHNLEH